MSKKQTKRKDGRRFEVTAVKTLPPFRVLKPSLTSSTEGTPDDQVRQRAYQLWEAAGHPPGDGVNFWLDAEREVRPS